MSTLDAKLDEMLQMLKAKQVQHYAFSQAKTGKDTAVAAALAALGLSGFAAGELPKRWPRGWAQKAYTPFDLWPAGGQVYEATYSSQLYNHFHASLTAFGVPLDIKDGFELMDVQHQTSKLNLLVLLQQAQSYSVVAQLLSSYHIALWCGNCKPEYCLIGRSHLNCSL